MDKIWITRYAMTTGIKCCEWDGRISEYGYVFPKGVHISLKLGKDAHRSAAEALVAAEALRRRKIASLKKSIQKFEAMRFDA